MASDEAQSVDYNRRIECLRHDEFPMLRDSIYLDHAGATLPSKSLMSQFSNNITSTLYGNPHSASGSSMLSTARIEDVRLRLLEFLRADPEQFDLVFVANATAGVKLVGEAFRAMPLGFNYAYHQACHTSLVGLRGEARSSCCLDDAAVEAWCNGQAPFDGKRQETAATLFAYTAQSHMTGRRYPWSWSRLIRDGTRPANQPVYTLLDVASHAATSPINLADRDSAPDFIVLSLYKVFGFPDMGALLVRRQAEHVFTHRRYFGGGTVAMVVCGKEDWHASKDSFLHERLEDGTLPFHNIIALGCALDTHRKLFTSMSHVASHTDYLRRRLQKGLSEMRHANGRPVCVFYSDTTRHFADMRSQGPVVSFNIRNSADAWVGLEEFEKLAALRSINIRTGGLCAPGSIANALGLEPWEMKRNFSAGFRCGGDNEIMAGKPTGVIRASLGAMSTLSDVDAFLDFIQEFYRDSSVPVAISVAPLSHTQQSSFKVQSLTVYPIKSCAGFEIPGNTPWEIRPEGLAWDREWCLFHRGTGQALSQKRYPKMALIRPLLDFDRGLLRITFHSRQDEISVPLSSNPAMFDANGHYRPSRSRVCGEEISALACTLAAVNNFFSEALGVPCVLARFPPGGEGRGMRYAKAGLSPVKGSLPSLISGRPWPDNTTPVLPPPSPPDSDTELGRSKILLSNESPILVVNAASVAVLNRHITAAGGKPVSHKAFRANIVLKSASPSAQGADGGYEEDVWTRLRIGPQEFAVMGGCRRCQMVCIDQESGEKGAEPFATLSKTRRIEGKVYFGAHVRHCPPQQRNTHEAQYPTVSVGDEVEVQGH